MKNILFICTGNTCRSPMAEAIANKILKDMKLNMEYRASSAGIYAFPGDSASSQAIDVMNEMGIDIKGHKARQVDSDIMNGAFIILTMTSAHKSSITSMYPDAKDRVFSLKEFVDGVCGDIYDPYGRSVEVYRACAKELNHYISEAVKKLSGD